MKKILLVVLTIVFVATMAFAGNRPEFDAVGVDSQNYFNDFIKNAVVDNGIDRNNVKINDFSDFIVEAYMNTAGQSQPDPCFEGYYSNMVDSFNDATYSWTIVLQMKPESDINLNVRDCVLKHNTFDVWNAADQTGRYQMPWPPYFFFVRSANPSITAVAHPGPYASAGFTQPFYMNARTLPGLATVVLKDQLYTSKGLWEEGIVMEMPLSGTFNALGESVYNLKQGDYIEITVKVPYGHPNDVFYGADNVVLKYIGIVGTEFTTLSQ